MSYPNLDGSLNPYLNDYSYYAPGQPAATTWFKQDSEFNISNLEPVIDATTCAWLPDIPSWGVDYSTDGLKQATQSWIAPNNPLLPLAIRQMLSWNRDKYINATAFYDRNANMGRKYMPKPLVPVAVRLTPMPNSTGGYPVQNNWTSRGDAIGMSSCPTGCQFPTVVTDKWRVDITWDLDEFRNRFNIQYAKVEIEPSIRLESIQGSNLGVIPLGDNGGPDYAAAADLTKINNVTTGFPAREPQLLIKITYPWVRLTGDAPSVLNAGPIGIWTDEPNSPNIGKSPVGNLLGKINDKTFLGFPRGRVLYQSADLVEAVSPISGRLGYRVTHVFLALPTASWNMTRYQGEMSTLTLPADTVWPYGYMVARNKDGTVKQGVFPYAHVDLNRLLYYNDPANNNPLVPTDEG